jgi:hypothetical protein
MNEILSPCPFHNIDFLGLKSVLPDITRSRKENQPYTTVLVKVIKSVLLLASECSKRNIVEPNFRFLLSLVGWLFKDALSIETI